MRIDITLSGINPDLQSRSSPGKLTHYPYIIHRTVWVLATDRYGQGPTLVGAFFLARQRGHKVRPYVLLHESGSGRVFKLHDSGSCHPEHSDPSSAQDDSWQKASA